MLGLILATDGWLIQLISHVYFASQFCNDFACVAPSEPPVGVSHLEVTSTSVTLSWKPPETSQQNGVIRSYIVNVREEETGRNFSVNSTNTELSIGNLHPFYTYHFAVAAVTISQGPFTYEYALQTLEDGKYSGHNV